MNCKGRWGRGFEHAKNAIQSGKMNWDDFFIANLEI
jgi:hypothetical protein